jgi:hypothetical protein
MFPFLDVKAVYKWNFKWSICIFRRPNQTVCKPLYTIAIVSELKRFILKSHFIVSLFKGTQWLQKVSKLKIPSFNNLHQPSWRDLNHSEIVYLQIIGIIVSCCQSYVMRLKKCLTVIQVNFQGLKFTNVQ